MPSQTQSVNLKLIIGIYVYKTDFCNIISINNSKTVSRIYVISIVKGNKYGINKLELRLFIVIEQRILNQHRPHVQQ